MTTKIDTAHPERSSEVQEPRFRILPGSCTPTETTLRGVANWVAKVCTKERTVER